MEIAKKIGNIFGLKKYRGFEKAQMEYKLCVGGFYLFSTRREYEYQPDYTLRYFNFSPFHKHFSSSLYIFTKDTKI